MNKYLTKMASLLKGKKLLAKINSGGKQDRIRLMTKSVDEAKASNNLVDLHEKMDKTVGQGQKVKGNFKFTDGSHAFVRGTPGKGTRSRIYK